MSSDLNRRLKGWPGWAALLVVVVALLAIGVSRDSGPQNQRERIDAISKRLACPTCDGESVFESRASSSENLRNEIARLVAEAELTDDQIVQRIDGNYTQDLTLTPDASGLEGLAWILPVVVAILAVGGLAFAFRHWRSVIDRRASEEDRELVAAAIAASHASGGDGGPDEPGTEMQAGDVAVLIDDEPVGTDVDPDDDETPGDGTP